MAALPEFNGVQANDSRWTTDNGMRQDPRYYNLPIAGNGYGEYRVDGMQQRSDISIYYNAIEDDTLEEPTAKNTIYLDKMRMLYERGLLSPADVQRYQATLKKQDRKYKELKKLMDRTSSHTDWAKILLKGVDEAVVPKKEEQLFDEDDQLPEANGEELAKCSDEELGIAYSYVDDKGNTAHDIFCEVCKSIVTFTLDVKKSVWICIEPKHVHIISNKDLDKRTRISLCSNSNFINIASVTYGSYINAWGAGGTGRATGATTGTWGIQ